MNFWNKFCGIVTFFLISVLLTKAQSVIIFPYKVPLPDTIKANNLILSKINSQSFSVGYYQFSQNSISPDYYTKHFGFFCKKELAFEKLTKIPFRFRLGSLQQCNYFEGKTN